MVMQTKWFAIAVHSYTQHTHTMGWDGMQIRNNRILNTMRLYCVLLTSRNKAIKVFL